MKIGVFDSGIGGTTVLHELRSRFPEQDFLYLGDTAHVPYGNKSPAQIKALSQAAAQFLKAQGVDLLVVACNTASCVALTEIQEIMGLVPVLGVVEAGVATAVRAIEQSPGLPILVLGTRVTIRSRTYSQSISAKTKMPIRVFEQECPLLVPMIEEGWTDHPILHQTVAEYVKPYFSQGPGIALLACTHYPWIKAAFESALPGWQVMDSAWAMGEALSRVMTLGKDTAVSLAGGSLAQGPKQGTLQWHFTDPESVPAFIYEKFKKA